MVELWQQSFNVRIHWAKGFTDEELLPVSDVDCSTFDDCVLTANMKPSLTVHIFRIGIKSSLSVPIVIR